MLHVEHIYCSIKILHTEDLIQTFQKSDTKIYNRTTTHIISHFLSNNILSINKNTTLHFIFMCVVYKRRKIYEFENRRIKEKSLHVSHEWYRKSGD